MKIEVKCKIKENHIEIIRKSAKLVNKDETSETYQLMHLTAFIENGIATIAMEIKNEKDRQKAEKKLLALINKFGLEKC